MDLTNGDKWKGWVATPHCEAAFDPAGRHNPFHELLVTQVCVCVYVCICVVVVRILRPAALKPSRYVKR